MPPLHGDRLEREEKIRDYLLRRLGPEATESLEVEYLSSEDCFEELMASRLLVSSLPTAKLEVRKKHGITILEFTGSASLTLQSNETQQLYQAFEEVRGRSDKKVLIDLSRVSRIDSSGLGVLVNCYAHAVGNSGMLKLLNPGPKLRQMMRVTRLDSVLETYEDERDALISFGTSAADHDGVMGE
jgi:anti-sigma B factor antagonist